MSGYLLEVDLVKTDFYSIEPGENYLVKLDSGAWIVMRGSVNGNLMWPDGEEAFNSAVYPHIFLISARKVPPSCTPTLPERSSLSTNEPEDTAPG